MVLFSMFCITFMEVTMLKKCVAFHHLLMQTSPIELRALRIHRRAHTGWAHRLVIGIMFIVIWIFGMTKKIQNIYKLDGSTI